MEKSTHTLIAARFTSSQWSGLNEHVAKLVELAGADAAMPEPGIFVFKRSSKAHWVAWELCDLLDRSDVPFVQTEFSSPLLGHLSETGQQALKRLGVDFWDKAEIRKGA